MNKFSLLFILSFFLAATSCKKWEDQLDVTHPQVNLTLMEQITKDPNLSKFKEMLNRTGLDQDLASSKNYTVFAPSNTALASIDPAITGDMNKLIKFVGNHIATQTYFTREAGASYIRIKLLNGKYSNLTATTISDVRIAAADKFMKNGVLHVVETALPALDNVWETLTNNASLPAKQRAYLQTLYRNVYDVTNAVQIGVNPTTGAPIYQAGTDSVRSNLYWRNVYDLRDESKEFTFFVMQDTAWDAETTKLNPYFVTTSADSTKELVSWEIVKDLAYPGTLTAATLPDSLVSRFSVKIPARLAVTRTIKTSNGLVHVMSKVDVPIRNRLKSFLIQGEEYRFQSTDKRSVTYFRDRFNGITGADFKDVLVFNHGVALFNLNYRITAVNSVKYRAYWVAVNDFQTATYNQLLGIGTPTSTLLPYTPVTANNYNEVLLGEFTITKYNPFLDIYLTAANSTAAAVNPIVCDYIKLVPVTP